MHLTSDMLNHPMSSLEPKHTPQENCRLFKKNNTIAGAFLVLGIALFALQLYSMNVNINRYGKAVPSTIKYIGKWKPVTPKIKTGELIHFTYLRETSHPQTIIFFLDSMENQKTKEIYPGVDTFRLIEDGGVGKSTAVRRIPDKMVPGTYILKGWSSTEEDQRTNGVLYESEPFEVIE